MALGFQRSMPRERAIQELSAPGVSFETYVRAHFRVHRRSRVGKTVPVEELMVFQDDIIKKGLLLAIPKDQKKAAARMFELLLMATTVLPCQDKGDALHGIVKIVFEHDQVMVDEMFCQLVKQTLKCEDKGVMTRTWQMFMILVVFFAPSAELFMVVRAYLARLALGDPSSVTSTVAFMILRMQGDHYRGRVRTDRLPELAKIAAISKEVQSGVPAFSSGIYEAMWRQKSQYPRMLVPYCLHNLIVRLKKSGGRKASGIFKAPCNQMLLQEILSGVDRDFDAIDRADVYVLASLVVSWLMALPNPVIPVEMTKKLVEVSSDAAVVDFVEALPYTHKFTLLYVVGFVQEMCRDSSVHDVSKADFAKVFGPAVVNPLRAGKGDAVLVAKLGQIATIFFGKLIETADASRVYPVNPWYMQRDGGREEK